MTRKIPIIFSSEWTATDGSCDSPFCRAIREETRKEDPGHPSGRADLLWRSAHAPEGQAVPCWEEKQSF